MQGLTAKVFRTYNASKTLQDQLDLLTVPKASVPEKILAYNRANRQVALLCNHQRSVPKTFEKSMETLKAKVGDLVRPCLALPCSFFAQIDAKKSEMNEQKSEMKQAKLDFKNSKSQSSQK